MNRNIRKRYEYQAGSLPDRYLKTDPFQLFSRWFQQAERKKVHTVNAAVLSTCGARATPSARVVLVKAFYADGFEFYTNYQSAKARDLSANPKAELVFYWAPLERQVRIFGSIRKCDEKTSCEYFAARPRGAQLAAWCSQQSRSISSRQALLKAKAVYEKRFKGCEVPKPPYWGGYLLSPKSYEFWQGRPDRLNDRLLYKKKADIWIATRLQP